MRPAAAPPNHSTYCYGPPSEADPGTAGPLFRDRVTFNLIYPTWLLSLWLLRKPQNQRLLLISKRTVRAHVLRFCRRHSQQLCGAGLSREICIHSSSFHSNGLEQRNVGFHYSKRRKKLIRIKIPGMSCLQDWSPELTAKIFNLPLLRRSGSLARCACHFT